MNLRQQLGLWLFFGWLVLPFFMFFEAVFIVFFVGDQLGAIGLATQVVIGGPFLLATSWFTWLGLQDLCRNRNLRRWLVRGLICTVVCVGLVNAYPRRTPDDYIMGSPFDHYWYFAPQTHFGFPFPFYRVFDSETPDQDFPKIGKRLFDPGSLIGDLLILAFLIYVLVSLTMAADGVMNWLKPYLGKTQKWIV